MPNLYFCQPHAKNQGMLRAVLSVPECEKVISTHPVTYVGDTFPTPAQASSLADFAVIRFSPEESTNGWRPGYYRFETGLTEVNAFLLELAR